MDSGSLLKRVVKFTLLLQLQNAYFIVSQAFTLHTLSKTMTTSFVVDVSLVHQSIGSRSSIPISLGLVL
jgi:hypothetical protein